MIFKTLIFIVISFAFVGCIPQPKPQNNALSIPQWYLNPTPNSANYLYGVGEGKALLEAKNSALNDMASRLSVTLNSTVNQYKQSSSFGSSGGIYQKKLTQNINVEVKKINFNNAVVEKSEVLGNSIFILMKVNKEALFNIHKDSFELNDSAIKKAVEQNKSKPILEQIYALEQQTATIEKATSQALILNAINSEFQSNPYIQNYQDIQTSLETLKSNLKIKLSTNLSQKLFANELIHLLNQEGYKAVNQQQNVTVQLNSQTNYSVALGWQVVKVTTNIAVISEDKIVSNIIINSIGRSSTSKENALIDASKYFKNEVQKLGLDRVLFNK